MVQEQYVSFETAKLLKEKGFDAKCSTYGAYNGVNLVYKLVLSDKNTDWNKHTDNYIISIPSQALAMRWLREVHNLFICIEVLNTLQYECFVVNLNSKEDISQSYGWYLTYEEACDAAIFYCCKHLI